jgi:DNA-binding transcriptional regulator YhcF (GntR family)
VDKEVIKINVFIKDKLVVSGGFDADMLLSYLGLRLVIRQDINNYFISLGLLSYHLIGKQVVPQTITTSIISGINKLLDKGILTYIDEKEETRKNDWTVNLKRLQIAKVKSENTKANPSEIYTSINYDYISQILNMQFKEKLELLRFYCYLMTTIQKTGEKKGAGFTSYKDMSIATGICRQTISKYMNRLESEKIIHIYKSTDSVLIDNQIREISNVYGDIKDKDKINKIATEYENSFGENAKRIKSAKQSSSRSASAKYNIFVNDLQTTGEVRYDYNTLNEIYETLVTYNEKYKDSYNFVPKKLEVFKQFDFYKGE